MEERDFLEEVVEEFTAESPYFAALYEAAQDRRKMFRELAISRQESSITQTEVANKIGTSQPAITRLENSESDPKLSTLERYASALNLKINYTFEPITESSPDYISSP